jgi:hypothetical protein
MDTLVADLRRYADALESGAIEAPDLVMVSRIYHGHDGARERTALDYFDPRRRGERGQWDRPHAAMGRGPASMHVDEE